MNDRRLRFGIGFGALASIVGLLSACGQETRGTMASTSTSSSSGSGGGGGSAPTCADVLCSGPGEVCVDGACVADCRKAGAQPCAAGTVCDVSEASPGQCVDPGGACVTTSEPEPCGEKACGPGSACDGNGKCYPRVPCASVSCDGGQCFGSGCACTRAPGCEPAPLGTSAGEPGTLHDNTFRAGLADVEFDPTCGAWGVTLISGPDYLRTIAPDGVVTTYTGITNLNMGEVAVLQNIVTPQLTGQANLGGPGLDVALSYICCQTCGCIISAASPQGVARLDPMDGSLPIVIPSAQYTSGAGPYGVPVTDSGPAGVTYGLDRTLYSGNVNENGDYYRLSLETQQQTLVAKLPARVYASTPFDAVTMLVAVEGGDFYLVRTETGAMTKWATSDSPVTGLVRDLFDGSVYVARIDKSILRYDAAGAATPYQTSQYPARLSIAPNGYLYAIGRPPPYYDHMPVIERWELPKTR